MEEGIYSIWKPKGPTSHDVVSLLRKKSGIKKVGHAGTLDPLAEGVLVVAMGRKYTKKIDQVKQQEKEYLAKIKLGQVSSTDDDEGKKTEVTVKDNPSEMDVVNVLGEFKGKIKQQAPRYSSVKIYGKEAYKRARKGEDFPLPLRDVEIKEIKLLNYDWPELELKIVSGPGVYIRSIARDIGDRLGCGGFLMGLTRTRVGKFDKINSKQLSEFS